MSSLPAEDRRVLLEGFGDDELEAFDADWRTWARPEQLAPPGDWRIWLVLSGRGWGKTRTGAEDVALYGQEHPGSRIGIIAPTYADARDTCVEGDSGVLRALPPAAVATWNRSVGEVVLRNGSRYKLFSADEPSRLRGPQHHRIWCDELAAWTYAQATFDQAQFGLRLGDDPRCLVTTTPRPIPLIRALVERDGQDVVVTRGSTYDNAANLAPAFLEQIVRRYEGTRLGLQEIEAKILTDTPGALWSRALIRYKTL